MGFQWQILCNLCYRCILKIKNMGGRKSLIFDKEKIEMQLYFDTRLSITNSNNILNLTLLQIHLYVLILLLLPCQKSMTPINIAENMMTVGITDVGVPVSIMYLYVICKNLPTFKIVHTLHIWWINSYFFRPRLQKQSWHLSFQSFM